MRAILAIDEGTTGVTCIVYGPDQKALGRAYAEVPTTYPFPGAVEQDAELVWRHTLDTARRAIGAAGLTGKDIVAIGITNQRETTVAWDAGTGRPLAPAIVWQDRRTAPECKAMPSDVRSRIKERTGLVVDPYFSATKMAWLLGRHKGDVRLSTIDGWLAYKLTGQHVTDATNASRTMLFDIGQGNYDPELMAYFGVQESMLADVVPSSGTLAEVRAEHFGKVIPLAGMAGDQQAALFGHGCDRAGMAKNTYGTGCFLLQHTGGERVASEHGLLTTRAATADGSTAFALEGAVFTGGAVLQWLRDGIKVLASAPEADLLADEVEDASGVMVVPAFSGLGAPYWDPEARGAILGLTRGVDRRHLARAALESIAFQTAELVFAMQEDSGLVMPELRVDGGASKSGPLLRFQADLLGRDVVRPEDVEATARGAAWLAALGVGVWDREGLRPADAERSRPGPGAKLAKERLTRWRKAVAATRAFV